MQGARPNLDGVASQGYPGPPSAAREGAPMRPARAFVLPSVLAFVTAASLWVSTSPEASAAPGQRLIEVLLLTAPVNVHGYQMSLAVDQIGDGTGTQTVLAISLSRDELSDPSAQVVQEHDYVFHLTPDGFGFAHDLSRARVDSGDRMGS